MVSNTEYLRIEDKQNSSATPVPTTKLNPRHLKIWAQLSCGLWEKRKLMHYWGLLDKKHKQAEWFFQTCLQPWFALEHLIFYSILSAAEHLIFYSILSAAVLWEAYKANFLKYKFLELNSLKFVLAIYSFTFTNLAEVL